MSFCWIDVHDENDVKVGPGPITQIIGWDGASRLGGELSDAKLTMYAADPMAAYLKHNYRLYIYILKNGRIHNEDDLVINEDELECGVDENGESIITVSGLGTDVELTYETLGDMVITSFERRQPHNVKHHNRLEMVVDNEHSEVNKKTDEDWTTEANVNAWGGSQMVHNGQDGDSGDNLWFTIDNLKPGVLYDLYTTYVPVSSPDTSAEYRFLR